MQWVLCLIGRAGTDEELHVWLAGCDVDAGGGLGEVVITTNLQQAQKFPSLQEALAYWKRPSTIRPFRDDGEPNRPLTAFTVSPQRVG